MKPLMPVAALLTCLILAGCQSGQEKQARFTNLQQQYNDAHKQYVNDCVAPMTSGAGDALSGRTPPPISKEQEEVQKKKCDQEAKRAGDLQNELQQASK